MLAGSGLRQRAYYDDTDPTYKISYFCFAKNPNIDLDAPKRRVYRLRKLRADDSFFDGTYPLKGGESTSEFVFPATDLATIQALTFKDN